MTKIPFYSVEEILEFLADYGSEMANHAKMRPDEYHLAWRDIPTSEDEFGALTGRELALWLAEALEGWE